jgi:type I restriction enzyme M protein
MLNADTKRKINNARDILVGKIPVPTGQVEQITLALVYKFMSDMDEQAKKLGDKTGFFMNDYEKYSWKNIIDTSLSAYERVALYSEGLEKMNNNPHIPQLFRDIFKGAFLPFKDPETLKLFLDQINEIEYSHSEDLGDAYEFLLSIMGSQGDAGQFRTPRHIIDFIIDVVDPKKGDKILDPACGTAGFLISAFKHILKQNTLPDSKINGSALSPADRNQLTQNFVGYDISHEMRRLSLVNLYLHQFRDPQIYEYDTLTSLDHWDEDFDCILANPPFMTPKGGIRPHNRFSIHANRSEVLFVDYIMEHLSNTGKAGIIVPEGIIFQASNAYKSLRKSLVNDNYLWAVVSLPSGVFNPYAGVKTSILLIDKNIAKKSDEILFVKVNDDGFGLGAQRREQQKNDLPMITNDLKKYKDLILSNNEDELNQIKLFNTTIVKKVTLKDSEEYNLSGERYSEITSANSIYEMHKLGDLLMEVTYPEKVKKSDYLTTGKYPVIDQSKIFISGYSNNPDYLYSIKNPLILFGDHTREIKYIDFDFILGADGVKILQFKESVNPRFMYYLLKNTPIKNLGYSRHYKELIRLKIPLPSLEKQNEIIKDLNRYQRIIDGARMVIDNWKSEVDIDTKWELDKLGNICDVRDGTHESPKYIQEGGIPLITSKNLKNGSIDFNDLNYISIEDHKKISNRSHVDDGDILYAMIGTIGNPVIVKKDREFSIKNVALIKFYEHSKVVNTYIKALLDSKYTQENLINKRRGGTQSFISLSDIRQFLIPIPPMDIQRKIIEEVAIGEEAIKSNQTIIKESSLKINAILDQLLNTNE